MDTELLKTFLEVQKTRHFGNAADNLYLTQSAVSFRIRQLEQENQPLSANHWTRPRIPLGLADSKALMIANYLIRPYR